MCAVQGIGGNPDTSASVAVLCLHFGKEGGCKSGKSLLPDHTVWFVVAWGFVVQSLFEVLMEFQETGEEYTSQTKISRSGKQA